jgi:hypothetical protein
MVTAAETAKPHCLLPELVPKPLWGISAYRLLGRGKAWKAIRQAALEAAGQRCCICRSTGSGLTCHERWAYDDRRGIAMLTGFQIHCRNCDAVTHMGRAAARGLAEHAMAHFCRVNGVTKEKAREAFSSAMSVWRSRNRRAWTTEVAGPLVELCPQLAVLAGKHVGPNSSPAGNRPIQRDNWAARSI